MSKVSLKTVEKQSFDSLLQEACRLKREIAELERPQRRALNGPAFIRQAAKLAGVSVKQVEEDRASLRALSPNAENEAAFRIIDRLTKIYTSQFGWRSPEPISQNLPYNLAMTTPEAVGASASDLNMSRLRFAAIAALEAVELAPSEFEEGCADVAAHEGLIKQTQQRLGDVLAQAADSWGWDDIEFRSGMGIFKLSAGAVHVGSGRGDVAAVERLTAWMAAREQAQQEAA